MSVNLVLPIFFHYNDDFAIRPITAIFSTLTFSSAASSLHHHCRHLDVEMTSWRLKTLLLSTKIVVVDVDNDLRIRVLCSREMKLGHKSKPEGHCVLTIVSRVARRQTCL